MTPALEIIKAFGAKERNSITEAQNACAKCGESYPALAWNGKLITTGFCFPCSEVEAGRVRVAEKSKQSEERLLKFHEFCPDIYRSCDISKLPKPDCYEKVMRGLRVNKGLMLLGASRLGKTRCAYALLKGLSLEMGKSCYAITELQFSHELSKFGKSVVLLDLIQKICRVDYLFIDDLGKSVMTERVVTELFYVIEERISHNKPIIATMQIDGNDFTQKLSQRSGVDIAEALIKRLREHCEIINFGVPKRTQHNNTQTNQ